MTGRATVTTGRRRSPPANAPVAVAVAVAVVLTAACGSDSAEPADSLPDPGTSATTASAAAPTVDANAAAPIAGGSADPTPPEVPTQSAAPLPPATAPLPQQQLHLDTSGMRTFPSPGIWEALRQCESQGDYGFVHPSGKYFGAYQFTVATWDRLANQRYTDQLGVLPSEAAPAAQDRMAYYLWIESGPAPWPACSHAFNAEPPSAEPVAGGSDPVPSTDVAADDQGLVAGTPFEPAPGDHETPPPPSATAEPAEPAEAGGTTASADDLPTLEFDPSIQPAIPPDVPGFPAQEQWESLRFCESSGNYRAVSPDGRYYGAYQFWPDTWDFVARRNYPRLVGVLPSAATPQDQDRMAYRLYEERGAQPWPVCGRYLVATSDEG